MVVDKQIFHFMPEKVFKYFLPKLCIQESIKTCIDMYSKEILNLLPIIIPKIVDGFSTQRGTLFGFGPNVEIETVNLLIISNVIGDMKWKLDKAPVHNLSEECRVGLAT